MIETERLILRPYALSDYEPYLAMTAEAAVLRWSAGPVSPHEAWERLLRLAGHWCLLGYGIFAVLDRRTGEYVGETGFAQFRRDVGPFFDNADEAGWTFCGRCHGGGYALEAASAAHDWYHRQRGPGRTVCMVSTANIPSTRLAEKLGYERLGNTIFKDTDVTLWERTAG